MRSPAARMAALVAIAIALAATVRPAGAQHEHHGAPSRTAPVVLTGTAIAMDGSPLRGAVVQLVHDSAGARHTVASSVTDAAGRFVLRAGAGRYTLVIRSLGHDAHRQPVALGVAALDVGTVRLSWAPVLLDARTVSAAREPVELRSGGAVVTARASAAAGGTIADLLRTVPGVELDADGRIVMRGSTGVLVLVDGRRIALTGDALAAFLRQMPAAALERIETGSAVHPLHDGEGAGGVVNLVFGGAARQPGMHSLAGSMATGEQYIGSAAAAGDAGGVMKWDAAYSVSSMRPSTESRTTRWALVPGDLPLETRQHTLAREVHRLHSLMAGASVTPAPNVSVTLRGTLSQMDGAYHSSSASVYTDEAGNMGEGRTASLLDHRIPSGAVSAAVALGVGRARLTSELRAGFVNERVRGGYDDADAGYRYMSTNMASRVHERAVRNDFALQLADGDVAVGHESRFSASSATHDARHFDAILSQAYRHALAVHAGYLTVQRAVGGLRAAAGARVEAERSRIRLDTASARTAVRLLPHLEGEWADSRRALVYRLSFARRITRPAPEMLNPFAMGGDEMNEAIGNTALRPEVSDQFELGIERTRQRATVQLTPFARWTRDPIRQLKAATERGGTTTRIENLQRARTVGADANLRAQLTGGTVVTLAATVAHLATTHSALRRSGAYVTARLTMDVRLAANTTAHIYAYRRSAQPIEQGEILAAFTSQLALTQRLSGDRGRLTLRLDDPLRGDRVAFDVAGDDFTQQSRRRTTRPLLSLFASYAVGAAPREDAPARAEGPVRID